MVGANDTVPLPGGIHVAPSILSADFTRLGEQVSLLLDAGAKVIHVDVMDGHFVPPITIGGLIVDALRDLIRGAGAHQQVHLMVDRPEERIDAFAAAGADGVIVHYEATPHIHRLLGAIRDQGLTAGVAINPGTPADVLEDLTEVMDLVLCMTVNPGWGGQRFIERSPAKLRRLREVIGPDIPIEVDGGIEPHNAHLVVEAGASQLVAGSAIYHNSDPVAAYAEIKAAAERAWS
jgi:ribulose-phosphate 3-epimerase